MSKFKERFRKVRKIVILKYRINSLYFYLYKNSYLMTPEQVDGIYEQIACLEEELRQVEEEGVC